MQHALGTWLTRHRRSLLGMILVLATSLRYFTLGGLRASIYRDYLFTDERGYHVWAKDLAEGIPRYWCHISPLPAYYMAGVYRVFGPDPIHVRYINLALGVATCWVLFGVGRRLAGTLVGLLSALIAAVCRPLVFLSITVLKEPLVLFAFALMLFFFLGELKRHRAWQTFCLGLSIGCIVVLRPNAAAATLVIALVVVWRARCRTRPWRPILGAAVALTLGTLVPAGPFMLKNYVAAGQLSPAPQGGVELYLGNDGERPYYTPAPFATPSPEEQGIHFRIEASRRVGRPLTFAQASTYWARQVAERAFESPAAFGVRLLRKTIAALHAREESDNHSIEFLSRFIPELRWPSVTYSLLMPLGMAELITGRRRYRAAQPLLWVTAAYGCTLVLLYCNLRLRAPLLLILCPFACAAAVRLLSATRAGRAKTLLAGLAMAFGILEHVPLSGSGDLTAHYNVHASLLLQNGDQRGALRHWHNSQALHGAFSDFATLALAQYALVGGNPSRAEQILASVSNRSFASAYKYDLLGDVFTQTNRLRSAAGAYEQALELNSARRDTRQKLAAIYDQLEPRKAHEQRAFLSDIERFF